MNRSVSTLTALSCAALVGLGSGFALAGPCPEFILDDGQGNFNIGPSSFDATMSWLNAFETDTPTTINRVRVSFGDIENNDGVPGPEAFTVGILVDPTDDMDPTDAVLLTTATGTWENTGQTEFVDVIVPETEVDGVFFVAVEMFVLERANPARMDPDAPTAGTQSWMFYNPEPNLADLGSSPFILHMSESPFIGAWMIRAHGVAECVGDWNEDDQFDFFDVSGYLTDFGAGDLCADLTNDGSLDFFDLSTFLSEFSVGCP